MTMGGIPFYWSLLDRRQSIAQNIDSLFFSPTGKLHYEYGELYDSLFKNPESYIKVVETLGSKQMGMTRKELIDKGGITNNGLLPRVLEDLEACGFVRKYNCQGIRRNNMIFQLIDNYTLFYYKFIRNHPDVDENFWTTNINTPTRNAWAGFAFERVCLEHVKQIKQALGISGVSSKVYSWRVKDDPVHGAGTQIDMVIDRADQVVNLCEMKFSTEEYAIGKADDENIRHKIMRFLVSKRATRQFT